MPSLPRPLRSLVWFLVCCLGVYAIALVFTYVFQARKIYFPPPPATTPFDLTFTRPDGTRLGGWIAPGNTQDALVLFGGNGQALEAWRARRGLAGCTDRTLILVPYRGYEGNPGSPREKDLVDDGQAVVNWAQQRYRKVGVFGISLGSGVATAVAAREKEGVDILLLGTPYDSLSNVANDLMPWLLPSLLLKDRYPSVERVNEVTAPVFVLRADGDRLIRAPRTAALLDAFGARATETVVKGGHETGWQSPVACDWLRTSTQEK